MNRNVIEYGRFSNPDSDGTMKLAFDIGGVLGKYPDVFLPMISALQKGGAEVFVLTDIPDIKVTQEQLNKYGYNFLPEKILCADFEKYGERRKSILIKEHGINVLVDDHPGYCADSGCVSLFVWPDPHKPYESYQNRTDCPVNSGLGVECTPDFAQEPSIARYAEVNFSGSQYEHKARYIHKYYIPQELRASISPVDISGIFSIFYQDCDFAMMSGGILEQVPDCVIHYRDVGADKHIDGETVRCVLQAIAAYHADDRAVLTPEENQTAMNLNTWLAEWEKDLLNRCMHVSIDMERQVRAGDNWLSDYEIDMETQFYVRDDDACSDDNMPDGSRDDIDCHIGLLCTIKNLENLPLFRKPEDDGHWYIGDGQNHNDRPRGSRNEEIYNTSHCATFHELFSHMHMPIKHAGRIGQIHTDIIVRHQNGIRIDLKGEWAVAVRDEERIRKECVLCDDLTQKNYDFLRHIFLNPESIGLTLDEDGFANIARLIEKAGKAGTHLTHKMINDVIFSCYGKRFVASGFGSTIRCCTSVQEAEKILCMNEPHQ